MNRRVQLFATSIARIPKATPAFATFVHVKTFRALNVLRDVRRGGISILLAMAGSAFAEDAVWKTAYVKRGFVGNYNANWGGGVGATLRVRVPLQFDGSQVKIHVRGCPDAEIELTKMALVKGVDDNGTITGDAYPVLFAGAAGLKLEKGLNTITSDESTIPITKGTWYVENIFSSQFYPYAYDVDQAFCEAGDNFTKEKLAKPVGGVYVGIAYRVDVLTTDKRGTILCYGDSITAGYNSTPNTGARYPELLGKLLDRPTLNLGQNGDVVQNSGSVPSQADLPGVDTVVYMMGINDIISGSSVKSVKAYSDIVSAIIAGCHANKQTIYIGTIPPAGGFAAFDTKKIDDETGKQIVVDDPAKETLRRDINEWIRNVSKANGVIDFDAALADPDKPGQMKDEYQSDKLHPSDKGYQRMAEEAAKVLRASN